MASKSKDVRMEQLKTFEKKLVLRLQQLEKKGISKEKALIDALVKELKSKIRQTNTRIAAFDKFVQRTQELVQAKAQKLAEAANPVKAPEPAEAKQDESKPKKKADKEAKKAAATDEAAPKKQKKQPAADGEAAPKKKAEKKKE
jgi:hypothetical protein